MAHSFLSSLPHLLESPQHSTQLEAEIETSGSTEADPTIFDQTTQNLLRLGSLTLDKFAQDPSEELDGFDIPLVDPANPNASGYYLGDTNATRHTNNDEGETDDITTVAPSDAVRLLRVASQKEFGISSIDLLQFEYIEESGPTGISCILTINRPNGVSRSYRTKAEFSRKNDAKVAVAVSAIKLGALSFIKHGDTSAASGRRNLILAKLDAAIKKDEGDSVPQLKTFNEVDSDGNRAVSLIEQCCLEWRAGSIMPRWVYLVEKKMIDAYGCALKVSLSPHIQRTYSVLVSSDYTRRSLAKAACAKVALEQGILEFIKQGDGLKEPMIAAGVEATPLPPPPVATTLHTFYETLPKPLPDPVVMKSNGEINAVPWLNNAVQAAKGSRLTVAFHWYTDTKIGLHGCLLHLSRPDGPSQSYLVDAIFSKRQDAKVAVCVLACSQGLGDYIRGVAAEIEARVSTEMKKRCAEQILPVLGQTLNKIKPGLRPTFAYDNDLSAFGCTLTIELPSASDSEVLITKQWKVSVGYKSKVDAKVAVVCVAADDGLLAFVKQHSQLSQTTDKQGNEVHVVDEPDEAELEEGETESGKKKKQKKKAKKGDNMVSGERDGAGYKLKTTGKGGQVPLFETREEARARGRFDTASGKWLQSRYMNGRGRGTGFSRHNGFGPTGMRGGFSQSSHGPTRRRPFSGPGGFPAPHPVHHFYPPSHPHFPPYGPGTPAHFRPYPFIPPAGGLGFPGGVYPLEYERPGYFLAGPGPAHERYAHGLGRPSMETATSSTHAPPPVSSAVMPAYHGHHDHVRNYDFVRGREYGQDLNAQPSYSGAISGSPLPSGVMYSRAYDYEYPAIARDAHHLLPHHVSHGYPQAASAGYRFGDDEHARRLAQGHPHAFEQGHYAPDYDRIPDRSAVTNVPPHAREPVALRRSESATSLNQGVTTSPQPSRSSSSSLQPQSSSQAAPPNIDETHATESVPPTVHETHSTDDRPPQEAPGGPIVSQQSDTLGSDTNKHLLHAEQLRPQKLSSRRRQAQAQVQHDTQEHPPVENETNAVPSESGKETKETGSDHHDPKTLSEPERPPSPVSGQTSSISPLPASNIDNEHASKPDDNVVVPSKRGRSPEEVDKDSPPNKRARGRSQSMKRGTKRDRSEDGRDESSVPPAKRLKGVTTEDVEAATEKTASTSRPLAVAEKDAKIPKEPREMSLSNRKQKERQQKDKSYVTSLLEHCDKEGLSKPDFHHEEISEETDKPYKIWVIMGKERLELPTSFPTLTVGKERLAKSVLGRLKIQSKKPKKV